MKKTIQMTAALALFLGMGLSVSAQKAAPASKAQRSRVAKVTPAQMQAKQAHQGQQGTEKGVATLQTAPAQRTTGKHVRVRRRPTMTH